MRITLAKTAGFCFGVDRAVQTVYGLLEENKKVATLGQIIHNDQLVNELKSKGVIVVDRPEEVPEGYTLVIRSHGVEEDIYKRAESLNLQVCDATCPFVAKIHKIVKERSALGDTILIAGDSEHQEVRGIIGHIKGDYFVFSSLEELEEIFKNNENLIKKTAHCGQPNHF